jgi:hypothetical protein
MSGIVTFVREFVWKRNTTTISELFSFGISKTRVSISQELSKIHLNERENTVSNTKYISISQELSKNQIHLISVYIIIEDTSQ